MGSKKICMTQILGGEHILGKFRVVRNSLERKFRGEKNLGGHILCRGKPNLGQKIGGSTNVGVQICLGAETERSVCAMGSNKPLWGTQYLNSVQI